MLSPGSSSDRERRRRKSDLPIVPASRWRGWPQRSTTLVPRNTRVLGLAVLSVRELLGQLAAIGETVLI